MNQLLTQGFSLLLAYRDPQGQIQVFRPKVHAARLALSCSTIAIPTIPEDIFLASINLAVVRNAEYVPPHDSDAALYIRPLVFGSDAFFAVSAGTGYRFCVYAQPYKAYHGVQPLPALVLEDLDRAAPRGVGHVKVGGNYAPVLKWSDQARLEGFHITLHLDSRTQSQIDEFSTAGFLGLKKTGDSYTLVVPSSPSILKSVTSTSCVELARSFGWAVELRPVCTFFDPDNSPLTRVLYLDSVPRVAAFRGDFGCRNSGDGGTNQIDHPEIYRRCLYLF